MYRIIKLDKKTYNLIRSFVESSTKRKYDHNQPYLVDPSKKTIYRKKIASGEWRVEVSHDGTKLELLTKYHHVVIILQENHLLIEYGQKKIEMFCGHFEPIEEIAFAYPISVIDVIEKMRFYRDLAVEDFENIEIVDLTKEETKTETQEIIQRNN